MQVPAHVCRTSHRGHSEEKSIGKFFLFQTLKIHSIFKEVYFSFVQFERLSRFADSRLAKSEFLHDEERRDEALEVIEAIEAIEAGNNEASLKLTAAAEEADEGNVVANKSNFSGSTNISIITVFMLTGLIV